jgi:ribosomal protein S1
MEHVERPAEILTGDRVRVVGTDQFGTVLSVDDGFALVGFDTGHETTVPIEQLSLAGH